MDISTMHTAVKLGLDKSSALDIPAYEPEEIDYWLNKAIFKFVKTRYSGMNVKQTSFEQTQKRSDDLSTLVKYAEIVLEDATDYTNAYTPHTESWFLPSKDELYAMYTNLYLEGLGGFSENFYWSSSEFSSSNVHELDFGDGDPENSNKNTTYRVRPIRTFADAIEEYEIGDVGPSGGWIFYITTSSSSNATYYEAAPTDLESGQIWSNVDTVAITNTGTAIGTGVTNTALIIAQTGHTSSAAKASTLYTVLPKVWPTDYFFAISEEVNSDSLTKRLGITQCTHDRYRQHIDDPYSEHILHYNNAKPLRLFDDDNVKIITDGQYTLDMYYLTYIREPATVDVDSTPAVDCDLPEHTHEEIVNITVNMMLENIEQPRYQSHSNEIATME